MYKKLDNVGKKKKCELVGDWARSVSNHLYWCASSCDGDGELVLRNGYPSSAISLMFMKVTESDFPNVYMVK